MDLRQVSAALIATLGLASLPVAVLPANVASACTTGRPNDGVYRWVGSTKGIAPPSSSVHLEAEIRIDRPTVVSQSSAMAQVADSASNAWMEAGYFVDSSGNIAGAFAWKVIGSPFIHYSFAASVPSPGQSAKYEVNYNTVTDRGDGFQDSVNIGFNIYNPLSPNELQIFGQTATHTDQMPGETSSHVIVQNAYYSIDAGTLQNFAGTAINSDPSSTGYGLSGTSTTSFEIWDKQC